MSDRRQKIEAEARRFLQTQGLVTFEDGPGHELAVRTLRYRGPETLAEYNAHVGLVADLIERLVEEAVAARATAMEAWEIVPEGKVKAELVAARKDMKLWKESALSARERERVLREVGEQVMQVYRHDCWCGELNEAEPKPCLWCRFRAALRDEPEEPKLCEGCGSKPERPHYHGTGADADPEVKP